MIDAKNVHFSYRGMESVLKGMELHEDGGHCIALLGNNGAGKSTFLKCLNKILEPQSGNIVVDGMVIANTLRSAIAKKMAYVEQRTVTTQLTVYDTVLLGRKPHIKFQPTEEDYRIVDGAIRRLGLEKLSLRNVCELSGGELQKVSIARALAQEPRILLLDEPTASLDLRNQHEVMQIASEIAKQDQIMVVIVIHDLNLALKYCDRFLLFHDGMAYSYGDSSVITAETIRAVYNVEAFVLKVGTSKVVVVE